MKKYIKRNFFLYDLVVKILYILKGKTSWKILFYNTKKDLDFNIKNLKEINKSYNFSFEKINDIFRYDFRYAIFEELKKFYNNNSLKILEIGTFKGDFANYLAKKFENSEITTIDLEKTDPRFIQTYDRSEKEMRTKFLNYRDNNLSLNNIKFLEMDSVNLMKVFQKDTFDIIWVDGYHIDPVVTKDLYSSLNLIKKNGFVVIDDVYKTEPPGTNCSTDSFLTLKKLNKENNVNYILLNKFVRPANYKVNPYVAFFKK